LLATDLGMGQPLEQALRTCLLAVAAGRELGLEDAVLRDVCYLALLRFVGCTADAHEQAALGGGDEIAYYAGVAPLVMAGTSDYLVFLVRRFAADAPPPTRLRSVGRVLANGTRGATPASVTSSNAGTARVCPATWRAKRSPPPLASWRLPAASTSSTASGRVAEAATESVWEAVLAAGCDPAKRRCARPPGGGAAPGRGDAGVHTRSRTSPMTSPGPNRPTVPRG
jgi:hypothetical protein